MGVALESKFHGVRVKATAGAGLELRFAKTFRVVAIVILNIRIRVRGHGSS